MIYPIRYYGDPVLRRRAAPIETFDDALAAFADDLIATMYDANGVGLAAPQVGVSRRVFVALETGPVEDDDETEDEEDAAEPTTPEEKRARWGVIAEHVMVNPTLVERSGEQYGQDGCLSMPGLYVERLRRDLALTVRYQDVCGAWHERTAEGRFAHVLQHEYDHLEGVLFFDHLPRDERLAFLEANRTELAEMQRDAKQLLKEIGKAPLAEIR